ncbi:MAG: HAD-IIIC family phosphatase [Lachnospiraceae bacterium]|nr:HAD-IIIC family phosphatase [Lachnospiraceae bacterium]
MINELNYPFDAEYIMAKKKKIKKTLLENTAGMVPKKIAILGGSTTNDIKLVMELFLLNYGIIPEFYESEYNRYYQDAMFENAELEKFAPDVIYIHTSNRNITTYPNLSSSKEDVEALLKAEMDKFSGMWKHLKEKYKCPIIQNNFDYPYYRLMGNKDSYDFHGHTYFVNRLNQAFTEFAADFEGLYICDLNYISADYGLKAWADPFYWYMYKYALCVPAIPYLSFNVANIIKSLFGKNKKGFVLDLDNTLWGGVIGDDGVDNIALGPEESEGQAYLEFQRYIKEHKQLGIILNVDSKNDYENAIAGLNHPDSELKPDEFIEIKANWDPKDRNFAQIASSLTLLPESLVFVDDNPAERAIVTGQLPGVCAPEIHKAEEYIGIIDRSGFFEVTNLSKDDLNRNAMYKENALRASLQASFENYEDYLLSLEMKAVIRSFEPIYMARIAQLTNKSNQFNLTTKRFTQEEIEAVAADDSYITLYGKLEDKFGDNGVVSVVIGHIQGDVCHIELWLMSCRVLKRDMEVAMMDELVKICSSKNIKTVVGHYYPTAKNHMVSEFYDNFGFVLESEDEDGNKEYSQRVADYEYKNKVIVLV